MEKQVNTLNDISNIYPNNMKVSKIMPLEILKTGLILKSMDFKLGKIPASRIKYRKINKWNYEIVSEYSVFNLTDFNLDKIEYVEIAAFKPELMFNEYLNKKNKDLEIKCKGTNMTVLFTIKQFNTAISNLSFYDPSICRHDEIDFVHFIISSARPLGIRLLDKKKKLIGFTHPFYSLY